MKKHEIGAFLFSICIILFAVYVVSGNDTDDISTSIDEAESRIQEKESIYEQIQKNLADLNDSKDDLSEYMKGIKENYSLISDSIDGVLEEIDIKREMIDQINLELEKAAQDQSLQYEAMKQRIKYMYEVGDTGYMEAFLSDDSLDVILNRMEYVSELVKYDRNKLSEYEDLLLYIQKAKDDLEEEMKGLEKLKQEKESDQVVLSQMMSNASENIKNKESQIDEAELEAESYAALLDEEKNSLEELKEEESRRIEESIRMSIEESSKEAAGIYEEATTCGPYDASDDEVMQLAAIIYCEARGEPYQGMLAVGSVVMNRVADTRFPNTIEEVILSPNQFSPVASGLYSIALAKGANDTCIQAAKEVLFDGVRIGPWVYFRTVNDIIKGTVIGNHVFYYR